MTDPPTERIGLLPYLTKAIALMLLCGFSGFIVVTFHSAGWLPFIVSLALGGFLGLMVGGIVGVPMLPTLLAMVAFGGLIEGILRGFSHYGWVGAILGGLIGFVAGHIAALLPLMVIHFILCVCGIDPLAGLQAVEEKRSGSSP